MIQRIRRRIFKEKYEIKTVAIKDCVHYCGFKYGGQQYNPYETFITRYHHEPENLTHIKHEFISFLRHYYPSSFNDAFGLGLKKEYALWLYPWFKHGNIIHITNWVNEPDNIIDIITHFSENGIPSYKIDQEFYWMIRALNTIKQSGYQPERFSYIEALKFIDNHNQESYLLLDGNHRISSLHALGETSVKVLIRQSSIVKEKNVNSWPNVKNGYFSKTDALAIFKCYFNSQVVYQTSDKPAKILDCSSDYTRYD